MPPSLARSGGWGGPKTARESLAAAASSAASARALLAPLGSVGDGEQLETLHQLARARHPRPRGADPAEVAALIAAGSLPAHFLEGGGGGASGLIHPRRKAHDAAEVLEGLADADRVPTERPPWQRELALPDSRAQVIVRKPSA
jgi:hypothetical protein